MAIRKMPNLPQTRGKAWGNTLSGGYKTQRRDVAGKFATSAQSYKAKKEAGRSYKAGRTIVPRTKAQKKGARVTGTQVKVGAAAGTAAAALAIGPSVSFGRKHMGLSISPDFNIGKNYKVSSHHSVAIDRVTDDAVDRRRKKAQARASKMARRVVGNGVAGDIADNAIGTKSEFTIRGTRFKTNEPAPSRRWRSSPSPVPGSPGGAKGKSKKKPQGGSRGATTITNKTKGKTGIKAGAKQGGGRKQRRKKK